MLQIMIMLIVVVVVVILIFGGYKKNIFLVLMNVSFLGMLWCLLCYFVKIGGALPSDAVILYGADWVLDWVGSLPLQLNALGLWENIFRFGVVYFFFVHSLRSNISAKMALKSRKYVYLLCALPMIALVYYSSPSMLYGKYVYDYAYQTFIVQLQFFVIILYLAISFVLLLVEHKSIALSWYKKQHIANMLQMSLFCVPFVMFAQLDPTLIYQDYMRVCVFTDPFLISSGSSMAVWAMVFLVCVLALISMVVQNYLFLKFDYDRVQLELSISQKVSSAELTASMLLHGLKNQLLSANILAKKLNRELELGDCEKEKLVEMSSQLLAVNTEMSEKLSNLYRTVDSVKTVLCRVSTEEVAKAIRKKVDKKDTEGVVSYCVSSGYLIADTELLSEAIYNIVSNSIEAFRKGQEVKKVVVRIAFTRNHTLISITDNGCGMKPDMRSKIFMPFTSSKNSSTNWGLGLCYARRIIKQHMGDVRFESEEDKGTVFYVTLPRYLEKAKGVVKWNQE